MQDWGFYKVVQKILKKNLTEMYFFKNFFKTSTLFFIRKKKEFRCRLSPVVPKPQTTNASVSRRLGGREIWFGLKCPRVLIMEVWIRTMDSTKNTQQSDPHSAAVVREICSMRERTLGAALCKSTERTQLPDGVSPLSGVTFPDVCV